MPKASVDITTASREEIAGLLAEWGLALAEGDAFTKCYGGFSGSNYACTLADGRRVLLKCTNDQPSADVEAQVAALLFLKQAASAPPTCYPWALAAAGAGHVSMSTGSPSIVLDFLEGAPADKVLQAGGAAITELLFGGAGSALAKLHSVPLPSAEALASTGIRDAGGPGRYPGADPAAACFVGMQEQLVEEFAASETLAGHPFLPLHAAQVPALAKTMAADVPRGLLHGDPFLDNLLAKESGEVVGWVDWEDVAIGPLMFDVCVSQPAGLTCTHAACTTRLAQEVLHNKSSGGALLAGAAASSAAATGAWRGRTTRSTSPGSARCSAPTARGSAPSQLRRGSSSSRSCG